MRQLYICLALALSTTMAAPAALSQQAGATQPGGDTWLWLRFSDGGLAWNLHKGRWNQAGDTVEGERLLHFRTPQLVEGKEITWIHETYQIACKANTFQILWGEELQANLQRAFEVKGGPAYPITEGTTDYHLKRIYCDGGNYADVREAKGMLGVIEDMLKIAASPE